MDKKELINTVNASMQQLRQRIDQQRGFITAVLEQTGQRAGSADDPVSVPGKTSNSKPKSLTDVRIENDVQCGCTQKC